jgi:pyrroloquinoline quinone biosynthesis protein B
MAPRSAREMGHLPIAESLAFLRAPPRPHYLYTHLNNTNPLAHPAAPGRRGLAEAGAGIATDGMVIDL